MNELDFSGKRVLVVGGSSGIGNGIAQAFRARGARVHVCVVRCVARLKLLPEPLKARAMRFVKQTVRVVCEQQQFAARTFDLFQLRRLCAREISAHDFTACETRDEFVECIVLR